MGCVEQWECCSQTFWGLWNVGAQPLQRARLAAEGLSWGEGQNKQQIGRRRRNSHSEGGQTPGQGPEGLRAPVPGDAQTQPWCLEQPALPGPALSRGDCPRSLLAGVFSVNIVSFIPLIAWDCQSSIRSSEQFTPAAVF